MESNYQQLRLEVTCHDSHTQSIFSYAIHKITTICQQLGFKLVIPASCNHYRNASQYKIDPQGDISDVNDRKQLFEITYMNMTVFSKLVNNKFPDYHLLRLILVKIKKMGKQLKREAEILRNTPRTARIPVMYDFVKEYCQMQYSQRKVNEALTKFIYGKVAQQTSKTKVVTPYTHFSENSKHQRMLDIYQSNTSREIKTLHLKTRGSPYATNKLSTRSKSRHVLGDKNRILFDKVRVGGTIRTQNNEMNKSLKSNQRANEDNEIKKIYFSYLEKFRPLTKMCVRTVSSTGKGDAPETKLPEPMDSIKQEKNKEWEDTKPKVLQIKEEDPNKGKNQYEKRYSDIEKQSSILTIKRGPKQKKPNQQNRISKSELDRPTIQKYYEKVNKLKQSWALIRQHRARAQIDCCFVDHSNFATNIIDHVFENPKNAQSVNLIDFEVTGYELTQTTIQKSLRQIYFPNQIRLFPTHFQPFQGCSTNLTLLANMLIQINPQILIRIFQNQKTISCDGIYCVWLRNLSGKYIPVLVNDSFAVYSKEMQSEVIQFWNSRDLVYSKPGPENCVWFMFLEKAVAKVVGGYHNIDKTSISKLLSIVLGCPIVGFSDLTVQRVVKVLQQKTFYNKMAMFYAHQPNMRTLWQVSSFQLHEEQWKNSKMALKSTTDTQNLSLSQFLKNFGELVLSFFNLSYFINQSPLKAFDTPEERQYSCRIISKHPKNNCYLMFSFGKLIMKDKCKVVIYRQIYQSNEAKATVKKTGYQYFGEIKREGDFFFEDEFQLGSYLCILQVDFVNAKECGDQPHLVTYSQNQIVIQESKSEYLNLTTKIERNQGNTRKRSPPHYLIEHWSTKGSRGTNQWARRKDSPRNNFKIRKHFIVDQQLSETDKENQF